MKETCVSIQEWQNVYFGSQAFEIVLSWTRKNRHAYRHICFSAVRILNAQLKDGGSGRMAGLLTTTNPNIEIRAPLLAWKEKRYLPWCSFLLPRSRATNQGESVVGLSLIAQGSAGYLLDLSLKCTARLYTCCDFFTKSSTYFKK
jgi:hypothetical protein